MIDIGTNDTDSPEPAPDHLSVAAEKGFVEAAAGYPLFGLTLAPYSPSRVIAAQSMGLMYPYIGPSGAEQLETTGVYAGCVKDVAIWVWLCTLIDDDQIDVKLNRKERETIWTPTRAFAKPVEALAEAMKFAIEKGMHIVKSNEFDEAWNVFLAFQAGMDASTFITKMQKGDGPAPEPDENAPKS